MAHSSRRRLSGLHPAPAAAILVSLWACSLGEPRPRPNLILVTIDTLRADRLGAYGYDRPTTPHVDALARESVLFEEVVPPCPATGPSVASILTGLYRASHAVTHNMAKLAPAAATLAEILKAHGYRTAAVVSNPVLDAAQGFDQGFDDFSHPPSIERVLPGRGGRVLGGGAVVQEAERIIRESRDGGAPLFLWLHLMDPHGPYYPPDEHQAAFDPGDYERPGDRDLPLSESNYGLGLIPRYQRVEERRSPAEFRARYDADIRYADAHVGAVVELLRKTGLWDHSLFILTADHGESLGEHDYYFQHGWFLYEASLRVPLLLRAPGLLPQGRRVARTVSLVDLAPTVLELLDLPGAEDMEGASLLPVLRGEEEEDRPVFAETYYGNRLAALRIGSLKFIYTPPPAPGKKRKRDGWWPFWPTEAREELYDLASDPAETENLVEVRRDVARDLRRQLRTWLAGQRERGRERAAAARRAAIANGER